MYCSCLTRVPPFFPSLQQPWLTRLLRLDHLRHSTRTSRHIKSKDKRVNAMRFFTWTPQSSLVVCSTTGTESTATPFRSIRGPVFRSLMARPFHPGQVKAFIMSMSLTCKEQELLFSVPCRVAQTKIHNLWASRGNARALRRVEKNRDNRPVVDRHPSFPAMRSSLSLWSPSP